MLENDTATFVTVALDGGTVPEEYEKLKLLEVPTFIVQLLPSAECV